jgi:hypothetical protein
MACLSENKEDTVNLSKSTACLICILLAGGIGLPARAEDQARIVRFKAVFVYKFFDYVEWPESESESESAGAFTIGILGESLLEEPLRQISERRSAGGRKIEIEVYRSIEALRKCHVLFISAAHSREIEEILQRLGDRSVLTISDAVGVADRGVGINFVVVEGKLKFEVNRQALKRAGLRASAQLLKLAILVGETG